MKNVLALILPHQLFEEQPVLGDDAGRFLLLEEGLMFGLDKEYPLKMHKQKLLLHRVTMKKYCDELKRKGFEVEYGEAAPGNLQKMLKKNAAGFEVLRVVDPTDFLLEKRLRSICKKLGLKLEMLPNPNFINLPAENAEFFKGKKKWQMQKFYEWQRKRLNILVDGDKPIGGKWNFDFENRKKIPKKEVVNIPKLKFTVEDAYLAEARNYVNKKFAKNPGSIEEFIYPTDHEEAEEWFEMFLIQRFKNFGPYEDAIVESYKWLYHSVLTPSLNIGLLNPRAVVEKAVKYGRKHKVPIESIEGFVRQIIGWREYMRAAYEKFGVQMRSSNYWEHDRDLPEGIYKGKTGIVPIDDAVKRILECGYCHHIERLMVLGGFMFVAETDPKQVYKWFMEMFVDSYDWVMVPNVYAMSQNSAGGLITRKPYCSGSNYIRKMSHYGDKEAEWSLTWDSLYWNFIFKNKEKLRGQFAWRTMRKLARRMPMLKKREHKKRAKEWLT